MVSSQRARIIVVERSETYRGREAPEKPTGGPGGPPPEIFLKKQVNGANLDHPAYFFNKLLSMKLIPFYRVIFGKAKRKKCLVGVFWGKFWSEKKVLNLSDYKKTKAVPVTQ